MEAAMFTTYSNCRSRPESRWSQVKHQVAEWRRRSHSRHELEGFSDLTLRDIGLTRCDANTEAAKPFWMA
jgi:uncharacterized protein YjiS (DUF1127 family)